ncbi:MAG: hypothetical protein IJU52_02655 [Clostridia bacterium]|nr:hypothetical protein [Clostridia bacterium]
MDIKALIEKVFNKVQSDPSIAASFTSDPKAAVKRIIGEELSGDVLSKVVSGVQEKLGGQSGIGGAISKIGGLFG